MELFLQGLQINSSVLVALGVLFFMIIKLRHEMEMGFSSIRAEIKKMKLGHKGLKRRVTEIEKQVNKIKKRINRIMRKLN